MTEVSMNKNMKLSEHLASPSEAALSHSCVPMVASDQRSSASKLDGLRLSPHFTLGELTKTSYNTEDGNIPSRVAIENLKNLCENWLEDLRYSYNTLYPGDCPQDEKPLVINSGYRSPEVNKKAGGSSTSNHLTGCAVDIRVEGFEQAIRYASILLDISDGTKQDLTCSRVCSHSADTMQASLCARSPADFDELFIERYKAGRYWIHFAVRPKDNRRKVGFLQT